MLTHNIYEEDAFQACLGRTLRPGGLALTNQAVQAAGLEKGQSLLDVGCGLGETAGALGAQGYLVAGLDSAAALLEKAKQRYPQLDLREGRAESIPWGDAYFDAAICECTCCLFEDPYRVWKEIHRVLKPGGKWIVTDFYKPVSPGNSPQDSAASPIWAKSREQWATLAKKAGFSPLVWEDATPHLRAFTAKLLWEYGSSSPVWQAMGMEPGGPKSGLGYAYGVWAKV